MSFITQGKTNWKFIVVVPILVVLVGGGILAYRYWWIPKHEWQIYRNDTYGIELKYPNNYYELKSVWTTLLYVGEDDKKQGTRMNFFMLSVRDENNLASYCNVADYLQKNSNDDTVRSEIQLNNKTVSAWRISEKIPAPGSNGIFILLSRKDCNKSETNPIFSIYFGSGPLYPFDSKIADRILSTFRFLR